MLWKSRGRIASAVLSVVLVATLVAPMPVTAEMVSPACEVPRVPFNMALRGHVPGGFDDVASTGDTLIAVGDHVLHTYDVSSGDPDPLGSVLLYESADSLWVDGSLAFAVGDSTFSLVDVSEPTSPTLLATAEMPSDDYRIVGFYARAGYAYASYSKLDYSGTKIFDISSPSLPEVVAYSSLAFRDMRGDVSGQYAYVCGPGNSFLVVDNADPTRPEVVWDDAGIPASDLVLEGTTLYAGFGDSGDSGVRVYDLDTPSAPALTWDLDEVRPRRMAYASDTLYLLDENDAIRLWSVAASPTVEGTTAPTSGALALAASGTDGYVAFQDVQTSRSGIVRVDASSPGAPTTSDGPQGFLGAVAADMDSLGIAWVGHGSGVTAVDASDPTSPAVLGSLDTTEAVLDVAVDASGYALLAAGEDGLLVVDASDPNAPMLLGVYDPGTTVVTVETDGTNAFMGDESGLRIVDYTSDPAAPTRIGFWSSSKPTLDIALTATRAYVTFSDSEPARDYVDPAGSEAWGSVLVALDISSPTNPLPVADHGIPNAGPSVAVDAGQAFVGVLDPEWGGAAVKAFDISDPDELAYTSYFGVERWGALDVDAWNGLLFSAGARNTQVWDVSELALGARLVGDLPVATDGVTVDEDVLLGTHRTGGLYLLAYDPVSERTFGRDRYETAGDLAKDFSSADTVVVCTGMDFPDALAAAPLAYALDAPILLASRGYLPTAATYRIGKLGATKAIVVGGTGVLADSVVSQLRSLGMADGDIERIGGNNRYDTARLIALRLDDELGGGGIDTAFIATGRLFPDALAASSLAAKMGAPILLTEPDRLPNETSRAMDALGTEHTIVLGGSAAVSDHVVDQLPDPTRLWGNDRYLTAKAVADWALDSSGAGLTEEEVFVVTGLNFPDAMPAGVVAARHDAAMVLVGDDAVPDATRFFVRARRDAIRSMSIVGGTGAIGTDVERVLVGLLE